MTEAVIITYEELSTLCDIVAGWNAKRPETLDADKRQALDRLIANDSSSRPMGTALNPPPKPDCL
jgi:hypothetical protein